MKRRFRAPSPAFVISLVALFVALGGTTAYASGLISGRQIVNHSIPAKKLTDAAVRALQGGRAISLSESGISVDSIRHALALTHGIVVSYRCESGQRIHFYLDPMVDGDDLFVSGTYAEDGVLSSVQGLTSGQGQGGLEIGGDRARQTLNVDVIAWTRQSDRKVSHIDLGGFNSGDHQCSIWGLITPGT
jgi:hypothetical protein